MPGLYVGLMSGTSMDGIDAVLVDFDSGELNIHATHSEAYPDNLKVALLAAIREPLDVEVDPSGELDRQVGECFRDAARRVVKKSAFRLRDVTAIGSHGQTLRHQPNAAKPFSLQIGNAKIIASGTQVVTVANFREADIDAGGQGAPLVPPFHQWLLASRDGNQVVVNIGGISNVTILRADDEDVIGFDTGPGNGLMDAWIRQTRGESFDRDGAWAASGTVLADLLAEFREDPYFSLKPPKSTGFEYFNLEWLQRRNVAQFDAADVQATLCELSAASIAQSIRDHAKQTQAVYVCGGGTHNAELMRRLEANLPNSMFATTAALGLDPDWVEAVAFAWLAMRRTHGKTGNMPSVTGASHKVVLGDIHSP